MITLILISYPIVVHLSIYFGHMVWATYYLAFLFALPLTSDLIQKHRLHWLAILSACYSVLIFWLARNQAEIVLFVQPVLINSILFLLFSSTLFGNSVPLISRLTLIIKPDAQEVVLNYCRWVTVAWTILFLVLAILSFYFAVFATIEQWSYFTNAVMYILIMSMFIGEYIVRKITMGKHIDRSFIQFIIDLKGVDYRRVFREW